MHSGILNLGTTWRRVSASRPFIPGGKSLQCPLNMRSRRVGDGIHCPCQDSKSGRTARSQVAIPNYPDSTIVLFRIISQSTEYSLRVCYNQQVLTSTGYVKWTMNYNWPFHN